MSKPQKSKSSALTVTVDGCTRHSHHKNRTQAFVPAVLYRAGRSTLIHCRAVPLFFGSVLTSSQTALKPSPGHSCIVIRICVALCLFLNLPLMCSAANTNTNAVVPEAHVASAPAVSTNSLTPVAPPAESTNVPTISRTNTIPLAAEPESTNHSSTLDPKLVALPMPSDGSTNETPGAPELGQMPRPTDLVSDKGVMPDKQTELQHFQTLLDLARKQRHEKDFLPARQTLVSIMETNAPTDFKRQALFEMALVAEDNNEFLKAQQIFAQYNHAYSTDPSVPEVLLRQGLLYRQMGVNSLAISKFYAVMSTALKLKLDNMDYYKKLVLEAQLEIADTYYLEGQYDQSADFFSRLLKAGAPELNKPQILYKETRSLSFLNNHPETIARAKNFLELYPFSSDVPEVRFILASSLKKIGRNREAMQQVLLLLQSQQENVRKNPQTWIYWQQRAGNEIANQLYKDADYLDALQIYLGLAELDDSPAWQLPVWYQSGMVYEQLLQPQKATEMYQKILDRQKELTDTNSSPSLQSLIGMAKWRKDYLDWTQKAKMTTLSYQPGITNSLSPVATK